MNADQTKKNNIKNLRVFLLLIFALAIIAVAGVYYNIHKKQQEVYAIASNLKIDGTVLPQVRVISPFHLIDNTSKPYSKEDLKGHWTLMFFGFTNCAYVCPTTMSELNKTMTDLKAQLPAEVLPKVVMVSVDPERDTSERMNNYLKSFNPDFKGLTGDLKQIQQLANQMSVVFAKVEMPNGNYTMNHSAEIMLLDPAGNLRAFLSYPHTAEVMAHDYELILKTFNSKA